MGVRMAPVSASGLTPSWTILLLGQLVRALSGGPDKRGLRFECGKSSRVVLHLTVHPRATLEGARQPRRRARHVAASNAHGGETLHRQHVSRHSSTASSKPCETQLGSPRWGDKERHQIIYCMQSIQYTLRQTGRSLRRYKSHNSDTPSLLTGSFGATPRFWRPPEPISRHSEGRLAPADFGDAHS